MSPGCSRCYYFPPEDVRTDVMTPTDRHTHCPKKGDASYYTISAGGETVENGAWYYPDPLPDAPFIKDLVAFYFDRMGRWLEEGEEIVVHPRDPYHRVDVVSTDRHIRVLLRGRGPGRDRPGAGAVRVQPAAALVHPARGRARRARAVGHRHPLPLQGDREPTTRSSWPTAATAPTSSGTTTRRWPRWGGSPGCSASSTRRSTSSSTGSSRSAPTRRGAAACAPRRRASAAAD